MKAKWVKPGYGPFRLPPVQDESPPQNSEADVPLDNTVASLHYIQLQPVATGIPILRDRSFKVGRALRPRALALLPFGVFERYR